MPIEPDYTPWDTVLSHVQVCQDCGTLVADEAAHTRFHSILASHGWVLAVLKNTHLAAHLHDKYDAVERIDRRKFDNWSADALAEVMSDRHDSPQAVTYQEALLEGADPGEGFYE